MSNGDEIEANGEGRENSTEQDVSKDSSAVEEKPIKIFKEAEFHKPPDREDTPPPPMPEVHREADEE